MYDQLSQDYDRFVNWPARLALEIPFLLQKLKEVEHPAPLRVLDAACATGQHAMALAREGFAVAGADLSAEMIALARHNAAAAGTAVRFEPVGFGGLAAAFGNASFDALLCLGNSLPHLLTPADLRAALADFAACLAPGGLLIIQNRNFDAVLAMRNRWMEPQTHTEDDREWIFQRFYDFESDNLIRFNMVTLSRQTRHDWQAALTSTRLYPQTRAELEQALLSAGFTRLQALGSLAEVPFDAATSGNLVLLARKA
jgi:2-polyprenyl-3-methyl-5-hydroxy-6-metoxy-1,4-benzoquinol methylase